MIDKFILHFVHKWLGYLIFALWLAVTSPPMLLLVWVRESHGKYQNWASWLCVPCVLAWIFGCLWLAMRTVHYMFNENFLFLAAIKYTLIDVRYKLAFIPLVGHLFTPDPDKTKYDDAMDDSANSKRRY
jgi:hypothetical protein